MLARLSPTRPKRLYRSFIKLFCNHLHEHPDGSGSLIFNLKLEQFGAYESNREAIRDILNDIVRAFGASVFFPHHRRGEAIDLSNEAVYLENTRVIADNIFDALELIDTARQAALIDQCLQEALKIPGKRASEGRFLQRYITQEELNIGPENNQSLKSFINILKLYRDVVRVLGLLVEVHNVKSH